MRTLEQILAYVRETGIVRIPPEDVTVLLTAYELEKGRADQLAAQLERFKRADVPAPATEKPMTWGDQ